MTDLLCEWFGEAELDRRVRKARAFWDGAGRCLVSINTQQDLYRQVFDDDKVIALAQRNLCHQARLPGINLPALHADFGTISMPKHWGGRCIFDSTGQLPHIEPAAASVTEALAMTPLPVSDIRMDATRCLHLYGALRQRLGTNHLWLRMPDPQGPFTIAGLIVRQDELLMAVATEPESVEQLLDRIADHWIAFVEYCRAGVRGQMCGSVWPYTFIPPGYGATVIEDMMPLLSVEAYRRLAPRYLAKLGAAFDGLHVHCCGSWGRHARTLHDAPARIRSVEFHYPFTRIDELACLADDTVFVPFILLDKQDDFESVPQFYEFLLRETDERFRYWFTFPEETPEAIAFARRQETAA